MARLGAECDLGAHVTYTVGNLGVRGKSADKKPPPAPRQATALPRCSTDSPSYLAATLLATQGAILPDSVKGAVRQADYAAAATTLPPTLIMVTIHRRRPRGYWIRVWARVGGISAPRQLHQRTSLKTSRAMIPEGMSKQPRSEGDADDLVEVWSKD